jgi:DNA replication protein DnaC
MLESATNRSVHNIGTRQQLCPVIRGGMDFHKVHNLCTAHFVRAKFNVVLLGLLGDGKTSLALAAGPGGLRGWVFNLRHGFDELVHRLRTAETGRHYDQQLQAYLRPAVLIVDDFGSQAIDQTAAFMVLQAISGKHDRGSAIVTSSKSFTDWRHILGDESWPPPSSTGFYSTVT